MKKALIGVAIAAVLGVGGYFALNKTKQVAAEFGDQQLNTLITEYKQKPYTIKGLQSHPFVQRADIKITESTKDTIKSLLTVALIDGEAFEVPLNSVVTRGEAKYNDKTYGYGKVVTTPIVSEIKDLPPFIKADTLTNTAYIGLDGDLLSVTEAAPLTIPEENFNFKGLTAVVDTSAMNTSAYDLDLNVKGFSADNHGDTVTLEPFTMSYQVADNGKYTGESSPVTFSSGSELTVNLSKGSYDGVYKEVQGLNMPLNNGVGKFDTLSIVADGKAVKLNNLVLGGGFYENGKLLDLKANLSADIDEKALKESGLLAMSPVPITPKSLSFSYALNNVAYDVANTYFDVISQMGSDANDIPLSEAEQRAMIQSLQKTDVSYNMDVAIKTAEGDADADIKLMLSDVGKAADVDALISAFKQQTPEQAAAFFNGEANVKMNKNLATITQAAMYLMMVGAKEEGDNYIIKAELKDGVPSVNGQPMM